MVETSVVQERRCAAQQSAKSRSNLRQLNYALWIGGQAVFAGVLAATLVRTRWLPTAVWATVTGGLVLIGAVAAVPALNALDRRDRQRKTEGHSALVPGEQD